MAEKDRDAETVALRALNRRMSHAASVAHYDPSADDCIDGLQLAAQSYRAQICHQYPLRDHTVTDGYICCDRGRTGEWQASVFQGQHCPVREVPHFGQVLRYICGRVGNPDKK